MRKVLNLNQLFLLFKVVPLLLFNIRKKEKVDEKAIYICFRSLFWSYAVSFRTCATPNARGGSTTLGPHLPGSGNLQAVNGTNGPKAAPAPTQPTVPAAADILDPKATSTLTKNTSLSKKATTPSDTDTTTSGSRYSSRFLSLSQYPSPPAPHLCLYPRSPRWRPPPSTSGACRGRRVGCSRRAPAAWCPTAAPFRPR